MHLLQLSEIRILEIVEAMSNPAKDEGEWIAKTDLKESGSKLKLVEHEQRGKCESECKTIQRAVEDILEEFDTDIAEKLWQVCVHNRASPGCVVDFLQVND